MINMMLQSLQARYTITANRLINFLSRVPLIRRIISPRLYGSYSLKTIFIGFGIIFVILKRILFRFMYAGFLVVMGIILYQAAAYGGYQTLFADFLSDEFSPARLNAPGVVAYTLTAWFILSFVGSFSGATAASAQGHDNDNVMINYLRADPAIYAKSRIALAIAVDFLLYLPYVIVAFLLAAIPLWLVLPMMLMFAAFRLLGEAVNLAMFRYAKRQFDRPPFSFAPIIVFAAAVYFPLYAGAIDWRAFLSNPLVLLMSAAIGAAAWVYIDRFDRYAEMLRNKINRLEQAINKAKEKSARSKSLSYVDVTSWHKNIDAEALKSDRHKNKTGFSYLNAIFFDRHSKFFKKKMQVRCSVVLIPLMLAVAASVYFGEPISIFEGDDIPFRFAPMFFFIMYIASMGKVVTASVFSNCDIHMLHYTYYRTKETTTASFISRFAQILKHNTIIALVMSISMLGTAGLLFGYMELLYAGVFTLLLCMIGLFFAFNDLFLYYVMQPYDSAGKSKSMAYKVIDVVIYIVAYVNINIRLDLLGYTAFICIMTAAYIGIGSVLLVSLAPKKFKLR